MISNFSYFFYGHDGNPQTFEMSQMGSPETTMSTISSLESEPPEEIREVKNEEASGSPVNQKKCVEVSKPPLPTVKKQKEEKLDKTILCMSSLYGRCRGGCGRAHHLNELVPVPVSRNYKTENCNRYNCLFGDRCNYIHADEIVSRKLNTVSVSIYDRNSHSFVIYRKGYFN